MTLIRLGSGTIEDVLPAVAREMVAVKSAEYVKLGAKPVVETAAISGPGENAAMRSPQMNLWQRGPNS